MMAVYSNAGVVAMRVMQLEGRTVLLGLCMAHREVVLDNELSGVYSILASV